jgi:hypothetical protein
VLLPVECIPVACGKRQDAILDALLMHYEKPTAVFSGTAGDRVS